MKRILLALLLLLTEPAFAQQFPTTMPANTVYGRLGIGTGPGQAIPLSVLTTNLLLPANDIYVGTATGFAGAVAMSGDCSIVTSGAITCTKLNSVSPGVLFPLNVGTGLSSGAGNLNLASIAGATVLGNSGSASAVPTAIPARIQFTGSTNFWVNGNSGSSAACGSTGASTCAAGSDSNDCLTPATACLTLQHVVNLITGSRDSGGFSYAVNLAHNTGTTNYTATCTSPVLGTATISVFGDTTSGTAVVAQAQTLAGNGGVLVVKDGCTMGMISVKVIDNVNNNASVFFDAGTGNAGHIDLTNITFGALGVGTAVVVDYHGSIGVFGASTAIVGSMPAFVSIGGGGAIDFSGATITGSASLTFTNFAILQGGFIDGATTATFAGFSGITGAKCLLQSGQVSMAAAAPDQVFPGSTSCTDQFRAANSLGGDVALNNTANYFDGPSMAQGTTGVWLATGGVTVNGNANDIIRCKLWDGTTIADSTQQQILGASAEVKIPLSGFINAPAANIRISCRNITSTTSSNIVANGSANAHDSTISGWRVR
jgi:hypothetical protein